MPNPINPQDADLAKYFTDEELLRDWFDKAIAAETLPKRMLVIWGVGGIGKSSLLRMFRLHCKNVHVPVGLASGDETKSAVDVLARCAEDLKADGVNLPTFFKTYDRYRAIQAQVEDKANEARKNWGDVAGKAAGKAAEAGAAAAAGAIVGSVIPGIGTIAGAVGGIGAEALVDWLRGFLSKPDIDLYTDPTKKLTDDFLTDVDKVASKHRLVLMFDTYEQMTGLDDWTRDVAERLNHNVLLVIAGRALVDWGRLWSSWLMYAHVEEMKTMTKRVMHELIRKYYATMLGGEPNPKQVNAIIEFSGGLPMVVNTAVQLWVKYHVEDFGAVKGEVVKAVVERLREGVPADLYPLLETAAALRYFNQEILRAVSGMSEISTGYDELRRFPFVRARAEGSALHDRVREMIEEKVRTDDPAKFRAVHELAAAYFEAQLANQTGVEAERFRQERLYHRICANEENGIKLFQEMAEELVRFRLVNRLRTLLNDVNTFQLERENSKLWRQYYSGRLLYLEARFVNAAKVFESISSSDSAEPKLHAYALSDWGQILEILGLHSQAIPVLESSLSDIQIDAHLATSLLELCHAFRRTGELEKSETYLIKAKEFFAASNDRYGLIFTLNAMKYHYLNLGLTHKAFLCLKQSKEVLATIIPTPRFLLQETLGGAGIYWVWLLGRYRETELDLVKTLNVDQELGIVDTSGPARDLGYALGMQGKYEEAEKYFSLSAGVAEDIDTNDREANLSIGKGFRGDILKRRGLFNEAETELKTSLGYKQRVNDSNGIPELYLWLGELHELRAKQDLNQNGFPEYSTAQSYYQQTLSLHWTGRRYFECAAFVGLARVKYAQSAYTAVPPLIAEAEQIALQYEYNDYLASICLTQALISWDGHIADWGKGFDAAFRFYKLVLVYSLRYNRFLLDEVLSGRPQGTPLRPIVAECLKRGEEGRKMLLGLREWWQTGTNDVGTPRPDTISPIPEGSALLDAEKIAREVEPGDGLPQKTVLEQIDVALV